MTRDELAQAALRLRTGGEGMSYAAIGRELGVSTQRAWRLVNESPTCVARKELPRREYSAREKGDALRLREVGISIGMISAVMNIPRSTLCVWLKGVGETVYDLCCEDCGVEIVGFRTNRQICGDCKKVRYNARRCDAYRRRKQAGRAAA